MSGNNSSLPDTFSPFQPSVTSYLLGTLIMVSGLPGWVGNTLVLVTIFARGFLNKTSPVIYKLIASLAVSDFWLLALHIFYLGPCSCLQSYLIPLKWIDIPAYWYGICWYNSWCMLSLIAINRYVAICRFGTYNTTFTHNRTTFCVILGWILAMFLMSHVLWLPHCKFWISFIVYSYILEPGCIGVKKFGHLMFECTGNGATTLIIFISYMFILVQLRKSCIQVAANTTRNSRSIHEEQQKAKETRLAIQFLGIALVYFMVWMLFFISPTLIGTSSREAYVILALLGIANSSINPLIYLKYNEPIRSELLALFGNSTATVTTFEARTPEVRAKKQLPGSTPLNQSIPMNARLSRKYKNVPDDDANAFVEKVR